MNKGIVVGKGLKIGRWWVMNMRRMKGSIWMMLYNEVYGYVSEVKNKFDVRKKKEK